MKQKTKRTQITIKESLVNRLTEKSKEHKMSLNSYVNFLLNSSIKKEEPLFEETINKPEKKEIASRAYFTQSEIELLRRYAKLNEWSIVKEIRYRTISSLAKKPKLSKEEFKAIYSVRTSINVLGANINRLIRNDQILMDYDIEVCKELIGLIKELKGKISYLEKCSNTHFKLKDSEGHK
jgi:hypothetical protein